MHFSDIGFSESDKQSLFDLLHIFVSEKESFPDSLETVHAFSQDRLMRPRTVKGEFKEGLLQGGWVEESLGPKGERSGCQDSGLLKEKSVELIQIFRQLGVFQEISVAVPKLPSIKVLSTGAMYARVKLRMAQASQLVKDGIIENNQVYFSGGSRSLFPAELKELEDQPLLKTEADMVAWVAEGFGFCKDHFLGAAKDVLAVRATTADEGRALAVAGDLSVPVLVISNAPFARRQALDIFKAILQETKKPPVVIMMGEGCGANTPLFTMIEELTYWINSAKGAVEWAEQNLPADEAGQVKLALQDIMHIGMPSYECVSEAYRLAFGEAVPVKVGDSERSAGASRLEWAQQEKPSSKELAPGP